jgi:hypothetical protein
MKLSADQFQFQFLAYIDHLYLLTEASDIEEHRDPKPSPSISHQS